MYNQGWMEGGRNKGWKHLAFVSICCVGYAERLLPWSWINTSYSDDI